MKAYSLDLRERVAAACQQPGYTVGAVAAQFSVSVSFVAKLLQRQCRSGSLRWRAAPPQRSSAVFGRARTGTVGGLVCGSNRMPRSTN